MEKRIVAKKRKITLSKKILILLLVIFEIIILAFSYLATFLGIALQWIVAILSLFAVGITIRKLADLNGWSALMLIGSKKGLNIIDRTAKKHDLFWNEMAMWGVTLGFGLLAYPLLKGRINKKTYALGIVSLILIQFLVLPNLGVTSSLINIPEVPSLQNILHSPQVSVIGTNYLSLLITSPLFLIESVISAVTGFLGYVFFALLFNAGLIILGVAKFLASVTAGAPQSSLLTSQIPGALPIIPGVDIPLIGVVALIILLVVHEFSHGVLARKAKVKLKSTGLLVLGIIPMGAFVEPDEKQIKKLNSVKQTKIFSAGVSANFIAMLFFFVLMYLFLFLIPGIENTGIYISNVTVGYPAYGVLKPGMQVMYWNGQAINNIGNLLNASKNDTPGSIVTVETNTGTYKFTAKASNSTTRGLIGVILYQNTSIKDTFYAQFIYLLYTLFALSFMLNFLVGAINLLPLPGFDGWGICNVNIKNKKFVKFLGGLVIFSLLINVLPWFFIL